MRRSSKRRASADTPGPGSRPRRGTPARGASTSGASGVPTRSSRRTGACRGCPTAARSCRRPPRPGRILLSMRASDRDREQALALLRARCAQGYMSVDTFERRVERTFAARTVGGLQGVLADLVGDRSRVRRTLSRLGASRVPAVDAIAVALPEDGPVVLGRSRRCDVVLADPTVSRRHVELRPAGAGAWPAGGARRPPAPGGGDPPAGRAPAGPRAAVPPRA